MFGPKLTTQLGVVSGAIKAGPGSVYSLIATNENAATRYFQLHNLAAAPTNPAVPVITVPVPTASSIVLGNDFFSKHGLQFSIGIAFGWSTTRDTYTAATASDHVLEIRTT